MDMFQLNQPIEYLLTYGKKIHLKFVAMFKMASYKIRCKAMSKHKRKCKFPPSLLLIQELSKLGLTLTNPVRRSRFKCKFLISPNSPKVFCRSSSCASSCIPLTRIIHPSMAANMKHGFYYSLSLEN